MKLKWMSFIVALLVMAGFGVAITRINQRPFFIDENIGIGGLHTKIFDFQPYYLYSYEKDGGLFVKVFYLQNRWLPKLLTLWLSGEYKGVVPPLNWTPGVNKLNCVYKGVQDGTHKKEFHR